MKTQEFGPFFEREPFKKAREIHFVYDSLTNKVLPEELDKNDEKYLIFLGKFKEDSKFKLSEEGVFLWRKDWGYEQVISLESIKKILRNRGLEVSYEAYTKGQRNP